MVIAKCVFCGKEQEDFQGMYYMKNSGISNYYCKSKCKKSHLKMKRDNKKLRWTNKFYEMREKRIKREKERNSKK